jgi:hypothetical protein
MTDLEAFAIFAAKGPVRIESVQVKANQAYAQIRRLFTTAERDAIGTARIHANEVGEGRGEFDRVLTAARQRIFPGT